jgi:hypothetical protein
VCRSPSESPPSSEPDGSALPLGAPGRRPLVDLCVVHRSEEIEEEERELNLALVAVVGGSRPHVSLPEVRSWVANGYGIPRDSFKVRRFQPEDFMITFSYYDDMLRVLHDPPPVSSFSLILKRWRRQLMATTERLRFKVQPSIRGIPAHARNLTMARQLLSPACSGVRPSAASLSKADLRSFTAEAWCVHPGLIPYECLPAHSRTRGRPLWPASVPQARRNHTFVPIIAVV